MKKSGIFLLVVGIILMVPYMEYIGKEWPLTVEEVELCLFLAVFSCVCSFAGLYVIVEK